MDDADILRKAFEENWILITNDKDFGEKSIENGIPITASFSCVLRMTVPSTRLRRFANSLPTTPTGLLNDLSWSQKRGCGSRNHSPVICAPHLHSKFAAVCRCAIISFAWAVSSAG